MVLCVCVAYGTNRVSNLLCLWMVSSHHLTKISSLQGQKPNFNESQSRKKVAGTRDKLNSWSSLSGVLCLGLTAFYPSFHHHTPVGWCMWTQFSVLLDLKSSKLDVSLALANEGWGSMCSML